MNQREHNIPERSPEEIEERLQLLQTRIKAVSDAFESLAKFQYSRGTMSVQLLLELIEGRQRTLTTRSKIQDINTEEYEQIRAWFDSLEKQRCIIDNVVPKRQTIEEALTDMREELARLEKKAT